jgi:hypothetical protein
MATDDLHSDTGRLPTATIVWQQLKPFCYFVGLLLLCTLLITLELVVRL